MASTAFTFFWEADSPFSQWHPGQPFKLGGVSFTCAERAMMYEKAILFGDRGVAAEILAATSPRKMKALGRKVRGFEEEVWLRHREDIVYRVNAAKFDADPAARAALLETAGTTIVEASPVDTIWGIGLAQDDPDAQDPEKWRGLNLLGKALTRVRDELISRQAEGR